MHVSNLVMAGEEGPPLDLSSSSKHCGGSEGLVGLSLVGIDWGVTFGKNTSTGVGISSGPRVILSWVEWHKAADRGPGARG
jgi:hypothetical protein